MVDVTPSVDELAAARHGIHLQLKETTKLVETYGSLAEAIYQLNLYDFIDNQIEVLASSRAWVRYTENRLRNKEGL